MSKIQSYRVFTLALLALIVLSSGTLAYGQTYAVLYNFGGKSGDPILPSSDLTQGGDGALYGASSNGGSQFGGTFFKLVAHRKVQVLYSFCAQPNCSDGLEPVGQILRVNGHFIGATLSGGAANSGTLFDMTQTGTLTKLYDFTGGSDGASPNTPILGPDGHFYGTASGGGDSSGCGTVYRFASTGAGVVFSLLHEFAKLPSDGCAPSSLAIGVDGNLYGTTCLGGSSGHGTVYKMATSGGKVTLLHSFDGVDDGNCATGLILGSDGNFYGKTETIGSSNSGAVFKITPDGTFTLLHIMNGNDGTFLIADLLQASDGNLYGANQEGGTGTNSNCAAGCGTLFQITPAGAFTVLHNFDFTDGYSPLAAPFQHTSGVLYGDTVFGGNYNNATCMSNCGVLYSLNNNLSPFAALVPYESKTGFPIEILGQGFTASTTVSFNGTPATTVKVGSGTRLVTYIPSGATSGYVTVTTSSGTLTSKRPFIVLP